MGKNHAEAFSGILIAPLKRPRNVESAKIKMSLPGWQISIQRLGRVQILCISVFVNIEEQMDV